MSGGQRAFAQKLSRRNAADVRKQVSSAYIERPSSTVGLGFIAGAGSYSLLPEVVDPPDYEELALHQAMSSSMHDVIDIPADDVIIEQVQRPLRTLQSVVPAPGEDQDPHVQECVRKYTSDYTKVIRNYEDCSSQYQQPGFSPSSSYQDVYEIDIDDDSASLSSSKQMGRLTRHSSLLLDDNQSAKWNSNKLELQLTQPDEILPDILKQVPQDRVDVANEMKRRDSRQEALFSLYPPQPQEDIIEKRIPATIPSEHIGHQLLVQIKDFRLDFNLEPVFCSMAVYDSRLRKKVTENFYFDFNTDSQKCLLLRHVSQRDNSTLGRSCVVDITHPSSDMFFVFRIEKILQQGDISEAAEPYLRPESYRSHLHQQIKENCERLGAYRMPLAWTAIQLSKVYQTDASPEDRARSESVDRRSSRSPQDGSQTRHRDESLSRDSRRSSEVNLPDLGSALTSLKSVKLSVQAFFKQDSEKLGDEDLYKFLIDLQNRTSLVKKFKAIGGSLSIEVSLCPEKMPYLLTSELWPCDPYPNPDWKNPSRELLEFPIQEVYESYTTYRNLLFVYPRYLNFSSRQGSARNISVKIQLMEEATSLPNIFGKSSGPALTDHLYTPVLYHNKTPTFYEEVKVLLPGSLSDRHYLLFTLYHVSCQQRKSDNSAVETPIGYTWLPLLRNDRLAAGDYTLPVALDTPPAKFYTIHPEVQLPSHPLRFLDNHKGLFHVSVQAASTVHTMDPAIDKFLSYSRMVQNGKIPKQLESGQVELELQRCMEELVRNQREPGPLVHFLPILLDKLLQLVCQPPSLASNLSPRVFQTLIQLVRKVRSIEALPRDIHDRVVTLVQYIQFSCEIPLPITNTAPDGGYSSNTMDRTSSMNWRARLRSSSNPNLQGMLPPTPDDEVAGYMGGLNRNDRTGSFRQGHQQRMYLNAKNFKYVHDELAYQWVVSSGYVREEANSNAWFIFELMVKGMAEYLAHTNKLFGPRKGRFSTNFCDDITNICLSISKEIADKCQQQDCRVLNNSLAFFLCDAISLMDPGFIFRRIKDYCKLLHNKLLVMPDPTPVLSLKLDFLRIVCSHEHFVALNLPRTQQQMPSAPASPTLSIDSTSSQVSLTSACSSLVERGLYTTLSSEYKGQHFLTGLVLQELATALRQSNSSLQYKAVNLIRTLLTSHDADPRYQDSQVKARVASLYLPLITIGLEIIDQLYQPAQDRTREELQGIDQDVAMQIAGSAVYQALNVDSSPTQKTKKTALNLSSTRHLLACFLWMLKSAERAVLRSWIADMGPTRIHQLLQLLQLAALNFEYKGQNSASMSHSQLLRSAYAKSWLEGAIYGSNNARSAVSCRRENSTTPTSSDSTPRLRWRKDANPWRHSDSFETPPHQAPVSPVQIESAVGGCLAAEVNMVILDSLELIVDTVQHKPQEEGHLTTILPCVLRVLLLQLRIEQSDRVLLCLLASERAIVTKFPDLLFEDETEQCAELCLCLLQRCSSAIPHVRAHAAASLYMLMRHNFEKGNNFSRVKMQVTMSLSTLVGQSQTFNEDHLRSSLKTLLCYADIDKDLQDTPFPQQVQELVYNLHMILSDTVRMKEYKEDPEMLLDLMYRIAKGYQNSPDLRLTWLQNMATFHTKRTHHAEAALCLVHCAGLVAEYLNMLEDRPYMPIGCVALQHVTQNVLEESAVSEDVMSPGEQGICNSTCFSDSGFVGLMEHAANSFQMAQMYEAVNKVYKVLIPIFEEHRDNKKLSTVHAKLKDAFDNIGKQEGKRMFGTYFRVGFYGAQFGDLDGEEFVYKEPAITKLSEIAHRLESFYDTRFGAGVVQMIKDSNLVTREKLDPEKAYIQVTYVEPYFDRYELKDRRGYFDQNYNLRRFMYATPFTIQGSAHGELKEQYKRKTIVTTEKAFPYILTRVKVIEREQVTLTPIEVAIEDIQKKTRQLADAVNQEPPDPKILQMVLQGCIGTTVNQGPIEVAQVFLVPITEGLERPTHYHNKLRIAFKDFIKKCSDALHKNQKLIGENQIEYQKELHKNYHNVKDKLEAHIYADSSLSPKKKKNRDKQNKRGKSTPPTQALDISLSSSLA